CSDSWSGRCVCLWWIWCTDVRFAVLLSAGDDRALLVSGLRRAALPISPLLALQPALSVPPPAARSEAFSSNSAGLLTGTLRRNCWEDFGRSLKPAWPNHRPCTANPAAARRHR